MNRRDTRPVKKRYAGAAMSPGLAVLAAMCAIVVSCAGATGNDQPAPVRDQPAPAPETPADPGARKSGKASTHANSEIVVSALGGDWKVALPAWENETLRDIYLRLDMPQLLDPGWLINIWAYDGYLRGNARKVDAAGFMNGFADAPLRPDDCYMLLTGSWCLVQQHDPVVYLGATEGGRPFIEWTPDLTLADVWAENRKSFPGNCRQVVLLRHDEDKRFHYVAWSGAESGVPDIGTGFRLQPFDGIACVPTGQQEMFFGHVQQPMLGTRIPGVCRYNATGRAGQVTQVCASAQCCKSARFSCLDSRRCLCIAAVNDTVGILDRANMWMTGLLSLVDVPEDCVEPSMVPGRIMFVGPVTPEACR